MKVPDGLKADLEDYNFAVATLLRDSEYLSLKKVEMQLSQPKVGAASSKTAGSSASESESLKQLAKQLNLPSKYWK